MDKLSAVREVTERWGGSDGCTLLEVGDERPESDEEDPDEVEEDPDDDADEDPDDDADEDTSSSSSSESSEAEEYDKRSVISSETEEQVEDPDSVLVPVRLLVSGLITRGKRDGRCERDC